MTDQLCTTCNRIKTTIYTCSGCRHQTCRNCVQKHVLSTHLPVCLNKDKCNRRFTKHDLVKLFGHNWVYGAYWRNIESNHMRFEDKENLIQLRQTVQTLQVSIEQANSKYYRDRQVYLNKLEDIRQAILQIRNAKPNVVKKQNCLVRNCPKTDCLGMIPINKDEKAECGLCATVLCKECLEVCGGDDSTISNHTCDKEILESVKTIFQDTKQCPGCGISIFKIEGCYQMWCTQCHTTFHYRTGEVLNERIHNPHYVEWLNSQKRSRQALPEEHGLNYTTIRNVAMDKKDNSMFVQDVLRVYLHINMVEISSLTRNINDIHNEEYKKDKRAMYIMKKWHEQYYKDWLYKQDTLCHKFNHLLIINTKARDLLESVLTEYINGTHLFPDLQSSLDEINQESLGYSKLYENKFPQYTIENNQLHIKTKMEKLRLVPMVTKGDECQVCVNVFNKTIRKKVTCQDCEFTMCTQCCSKYLLDSINEPCCMNCKKEWNRTDLVKYFGMHMYTHKFKPHKREILFEREKIHIPDTMELVERLRLIDQISIERSIVYKDLHAYEKQHLTERQNMYNELESTNGKIWKLKESYLR